jgi:hypothetical protein
VERSSSVNAVRSHSSFATCSVAAASTVARPWIERALAPVLRVLLQRNLTGDTRRPAVPAERTAGTSSRWTP